MRKISIILSIGILWFTFLPAKLSAQVHVGIRDGLNLAQVLFFKQPSFGFEPLYIPRPKTRVNAALVFNFHLNSLFSIQAEPGYTQLGTKGSYETKRGYIDDYENISTYKGKLTMSINYIELPVLLQMSPEIGRFKAIMNIGPEIRYKVGKAKSTRSINAFRNGLFVPAESRYDPYIEDNDFNKLDLGVTAGLGISVPVRVFRLFAEARYHFGLTRVINENYYLRNSAAAGRFENRNLSVNLGALYSIGKK